MIEMKSDDGISVKVIKDSISEKGDRLTTFELEFHRYILAEWNTHRAISKNASSCLHGDTNISFDVFDKNGKSS